MAGVALGQLAGAVAQGGGLGLIGLWSSAVLTPDANGVLFGFQFRVGHPSRTIDVGCYTYQLKGQPPAVTSEAPPPPSCASVGPNFSHHKARVHAVGWFPLGTRKLGSRPFAAPTPPQQKWGGTKSRPGTPPPQHALAPSPQAGTW